MNLGEDPERAVPSFRIGFADVQPSAFAGIRYFEEQGPTVQCLGLVFPLRN